MKQGVGPFPVPSTAHLKCVNGEYFVVLEGEESSVALRLVAKETYKVL